MITNDIRSQFASKARREPRTNLFAMATIYTECGSMPVKLRNISSRGALAEGPVLPVVGTRVRLCRGSLEVTGEIVRCQEGTVGVCFEAAVSVDDWLPRGRAVAAQQQIDELVHKARGERAISPPAARDDFRSVIPTALDLMRLKQALEALSENLVDDPLVVERHGARLQVLDVVAQALRKLAIHG